MQTKLILIRHGQSVTNLQNIFTGHFDAPLTELGHKQAQLVARYLKDTPINVLYSSDLSRAYHTAVPLSELKNLPIIKNENLREINAGMWEGVPYDILNCRFKQSREVWYNNIGYAHPDNGESVAQLQQRFSNEIVELLAKHTGETICVATHALPIRMFECFTHKLPLDAAQNIAFVPNASVSAYTYENGEFTQTLRGENSYLGDIATKFAKGV